MKNNIETVTNFITTLTGKLNELVGKNINDKLTRQAQKIVNTSFKENKELLLWCEGCVIVGAYVVIKDQQLMLSFRTEFEVKQKYKYNRKEGGYNYQPIGTFRDYELYFNALNRTVIFIHHTENFISKRQVALDKIEFDDSLAHEAFRRVSAIGWI